jgi:hypothetical protein
MAVRSDTPWRPASVPLLAQVEGPSRSSVRTLDSPRVRGLQLSAAAQPLMRNCTSSSFAPRCSSSSSGGADQWRLPQVWSGPVHSPQEADTTAVLGPVCLSLPAAGSPAPLPPVFRIQRSRLVLPCAAASVVSLCGWPGDLRSPAHLRLAAAAAARAAPLACCSSAQPDTRAADCQSAVLRGKLTILTCCCVPASNQTTNLSSFLKTLPL